MTDQICRSLPGLLNASACRDWVARLEKRGFQEMKGDYPPSYRNNDRLVLDDPELAGTLFQTLRPFLPEVLERAGQRWTLRALNSRFRSCRYHDGQAFTRHRDGAHSEGNSRSWLTLMLYLNDHGEFGGGSTRFYADRWSEEVTLRVKPEAGMGILFDHTLWHDGEAVSFGYKYVLRTDVLYECRDHEVAGHSGYVFALAELPAFGRYAKVPGGRIASASRDKTVRVWSQGKVEAVLRHHQGSVTTLCARGDELWCGSRDREIAIWSGDYRLRAHFRAHEGTVLALLPLKNGLVASSGAGGQIRLWDADGNLREEQAVGRWPWTMTQLTNGDLLVGDDDGAVHVVRQGSHPEVRFRAPAPVQCLLETDNAIIAGCGDGKLYRWQKHGHPLAPWTGHRGPITALLRLPDGRVLSGSEDDGVRLWDEDGQSREVLRHGDFVRALCLTDGGRRLASGSYDGTVRLTTLPVAGGHHGPEGVSKPFAMAFTEHAANPGGQSSGVADAI